MEPESADAFSGATKMCGHISRCNHYFLLKNTVIDSLRGAKKVVARSAPFAMDSGFGELNKLALVRELGSLMLMCGNYICA